MNGRSSTVPLGVDDADEDSPPGYMTAAGTTHVHSSFHNAQDIVLHKCQIKTVLLGKMLKYWTKRILTRMCID